MFPYIPFQFSYKMSLLWGLQEEKKKQKKELNPGKPFIVLKVMNVKLV